MSDQFTEEIRARMAKAFDVTKNDLGTIRTGRASPALIENIVISAYEGSQKLKVKELATITAIESKSLVVSPFDPATKDEIIKGILESNTGLNPISDGQEIRITIPPLSQERRQEYLKLAKSKLEAGRVMIRQVRHEEMTRLKRSFEAKEITEDEHKRLIKVLQEITDEMIAEIDHLGEMKEKELMQL